MDTMTPTWKLHSNTSQEQVVGPLQYSGWREPLVDTHDKSYFLWSLSIGLMLSIFGGVRLVCLSIVILSSAPIIPWNMRCINFGGVAKLNAFRVMWCTSRLDAPLGSTWVGECIFDDGLPLRMGSFGKLSTHYMGSTNWQFEILVMTFCLRMTLSHYVDWDASLVPLPRIWENCLETKVYSFTSSPCMIVSHFNCNWTNLLVDFRQFYQGSQFYQGLYSFIAHAQVR
jgi:hypothetical protein